MVYVIVTLTLVFLFLLFYLQGYFSYKKYSNKIISEMQDSYGCKAKRKYSQDELENIKRYFEKYKSDKSIDDITANDLDFDKIFTTFNFSLSAPGDDYFYYRLRTPDENIKAKEAKIAYVDENKDIRNKLCVFFYGIGHIRKISFIDFMDLLTDGLLYSIYKEYLHCIIVFISIGLLFWDTTIGLVALIASIAINIITYYKERGNIEPYIIGISYIVNFVKKSNSLKGYEDTPIEEDIAEIKELSGSVKKLIRNYSFLSSSRQTGAGNPLDILFDYIRMTFHLDIICFYHIYERICSNIDIINNLYMKLGELESYINISSFRRAIDSYCKPEFIDSGINSVNLYHPLINNPVKNNINVNENVLITGSNASGKSTFLKAIAVNLILGKSINTCCADSFKSGSYCVFSSMSIKDDISKGDSYFMAEIKAFKRIMDYKKENSDVKIAAFTDELLRGTNTVERVSACSAILSYLYKNNIFTFAATHDIELTEILKNQYHNFHFDEDFSDNDIVFNYKIKDGKATSKNAIKLLNVMGFDKRVVEDATKFADEFIKNGKWKVY